ncbi:Uncharacterised protein [uncultured archaeon]|nr:Uncharacterised protein [uncultured archaeon]
MTMEQAKKFRGAFLWGDLMCGDQDYSRLTEAQKVEIYNRVSSIFEKAK